MRRILFVADAASIHTRRWAEQLRDEGFEVHVASLRAAEISGVAVHVLATYGLGRAGYLLAIASLRRLARSLMPDVVHAQYVTSYGFLAAAAKLRPLVVTAWGSDVLIRPRQSLLMGALARYAVCHADAVTTVATHMNAAVVALGVPAGSVTAIPFGVDTALFVPRARQTSGVNQLRIVCTRNFAPIYSVDTLIDAIARASHRGLQFSVDLVGDGPLREALQAKVDASGLGGVVKFHGHVDHPRLAQLLAGADVFVTPARSDGNNVSLTEAMACGCFPIATNIPANSQWIEDGVNGLLYATGNSDSLADCIIRGANDPALRERAVALNRAIVEQRADWRVCVARMEQMYDVAISHARAVA